MRGPIVPAESSLPLPLVAALREARHIAVLTGAGISAESGIPTFRDAQSGLWARYQPMELASPQAFERDPQLVWDWYLWRRELINRSQPNEGHRALAQMEHCVPALTLITQNVDGFHQLAGSNQVLELHGNVHRSICSRTRRLIDADWLHRHQGQSPIPSPHHAAGCARPDVVWFGESLDSAVLTAAGSAAADCDLMLVVGTSGLVQPAAGIPILAIKQGARMIEINPASSELSSHACWQLRGSAGHWLPRLLDSLEN